MFAHQKTASRYLQPDKKGMRGCRVHQPSITMKPVIRTFILLLFTVLGVVYAGGRDNTFYHLGSEQGLRGSQLLQMLQLDDGRMVFVTNSDVNIYDGTGFRTVPASKAFEAVIDDYKGQTHLYVDADHRLWIKTYGRVKCLDLRTMEFVSDCKTLFSDRLATDFFVDSEGCLWTVNGRTVRRNDGLIKLRVPGLSPVQDMDTGGNRVFVFTADGSVWVFNAADGCFMALRRAYGAADAACFSNTSLVVQAEGGMFYQVRMGRGSVLLSFNTHTLEWKELFRCNYPLHTLTVVPGGTAYITTPHGYITMNLITGEKTMPRPLRLPDGTYLTTGINTVCRDREGGIWLGTYNHGVLYTSPLSGVFDTDERRVRLTPVLTSVSVNGERLAAGSRQMSEDAPFASSLNLRHDENTVTLTLNPMKFVRPRNVVYRYRVSGYDNEWHIVDADTPGGGVDDRGILTFTLSSLTYGSHTVEVEAAPHGGAWNGGTCRIVFNVARPWWLGAPAVVCYVVFIITVIIISARLYASVSRRKVEQQNREQMLLMRIQGLIEKCNQYESSMNVVLTDKDDDGGKPAMSPAEVEFLKRATALVEEHLGDSSYTVEQLGRDLCMERTGLYKKLMAIMDKSPQTFIRGIRLAKAAAMLAEGGRTVTEVAEATGFSSAGYFSKCFQREFGHKPSEHI